MESIRNIENYCRDGKQLNVVGFKNEAGTDDEFMTSFTQDLKRNQKSVRFKLADLQI